MDLIERVARAICEERTWSGAWQRANELETAAWERDARAAIAEVLDVMMERGPQLAEAIKYPGSKLAAADYWPFMLAQFRKEALGE